MLLQLSSGAEYQDPSDREIFEALASLDVTRDGEGFAIFEHSTMTYVQAGGDAHSGFDLEYQVDRRDHHFRSAREDFSLAEIIAVFSAFRDGTIDWSQYGPWSPI